MIFWPNQYIPYDDPICYFSSRMFEHFLHSTFQCCNHIWAPLSFFTSLTCETQNLIHYYYTQLMSSWKIFNRYSVQFISVQFSRSVMSDSLRPHELQNARPPCPSHPSESSQCTSPEHPVSCIKPGLAICFIYDNIHVSVLFSQIIPPSSPFPTESKSLFYTSVSLLLSRIAGGFFFCLFAF